MNCQNQIVGLPKICQSNWHDITRKETQVQKEFVTVLCYLDCGLLDFSDWLLM